MFVLWTYLASAILLASAFEWLNSNSISIFSRKGSEPISEALTDSVQSGAQLALDHCQRQFKWDRWNCPESAFVGRRWERPNRESAYAVAITSAGVVYSVTRNCSRGDLLDCGCDTSLRGRTSEGWFWGGCSDNVAFGEDVAIRFLEAVKEREKDTTGYIHRHNARAGREAVRDGLKRRCKCHGVSGTCSVQTCWQQMAPFSETAANLRQRYERAVRIDDEPRNGAVAAGNSAAGTSPLHKPVIDKRDLVYLQESPDYCQPNKTTGWLGTRGRACSKPLDALQNVSVAERRSCRTLCRACGLRVRRKRRVLEWHCNCTFHWCCEVTCQTCHKTVDEHFCE
ncbi:protein Wnt-8b-like [Anabrus simplex]|uniref:protein Wnt-8b-like n=1 Tax=Anabrus simplex TaxID=316456 RepID=UPI0035A28151